MAKQVCPHCEKEITDSNLLEYEKKLEFRGVHGARFAKLEKRREFFRNAFLLTVLSMFPLGPIFADTPYHRLILISVSIIAGFCALSFIVLDLYIPGKKDKLYREFQRQ